MRYITEDELQHEIVCLTAACAERLKGASLELCVADLETVAHTLSMRYRLKGWSFEDVVKHPAGMETEELLAALEGIQCIMWDLSRGNNEISNIAYAVRCRIATAWGPADYHMYDDFPLSGGYDRWLAVLVPDKLDREIRRHDYDGMDPWA